MRIFPPSCSRTLTSILETSALSVYKKCGILVSIVIGTYHPRSCIGTYWVDPPFLRSYILSGQEKVVGAFLLLGPHLLGKICVLFREDVLETFPRYLREVAVVGGFPLQVPCELLLSFCRSSEDIK